MGYDHANRVKYTFGVFDFGGGADETFSIFGPKGKEGRLWDYGVEGITEVMNGDTLDPQISVGTPSDADAYGEEFSLTTATYGADNNAVSIRSTYAPYHPTFDDYLLLTQEIPADGEVVLKCLAATGANLTGMGAPFCIIDWQW
jgi:hypothetical protein